MKHSGEHAANNDAVQGHFLRRVWRLVTPYWRSEEKRLAWVLLIAIIALTLFSVALSVWFNNWNRDFYNALQDKNLTAFWHLILYFCGIAAIAIVSSVYRSYLTQMLTIRWRRWLTETHFKRWLAHKNYYRLEQASYTDNPDQRLSQDLSSFTNDTLGLGFSLLRNIVSLVSFSVILWGVSGSLQVWGITIPGYMFWAALLYALVGSGLTHLIGKRLIGLNNRQQRFEADMRFSLIRVRENAEAIALSRGESVEGNHLSLRFSAVWNNFWEVMRVNKRLSFFTVGYAQIAAVFPFIVAAPRYFTGQIQLGELMQISNAFGSVQDSMSWFINTYASGSANADGTPSLTSWRATCDRLLSFRQAMENNELSVARIEINHAGQQLHITDLNLDLEDGRKLLTIPNFTVAAGERVMVSGKSGSGKSTLLRALGGLWQTGQGNIVLPTGRALFLPQKPYLPIGTLSEALSYPQPVETYSEARFIEVLGICRLDHLTSRLDEKDHWQQVLSPGEQQRVAFARALLFAPQWLYVDEATSAMDEEDEAALHEALFTHLPQLSLISVGHRSTLKRFHTRHLHIESGELVPVPA